MTLKDSVLDVYKKAGLIWLLLLLIAASSLGYTFHSHRISQMQLETLRSELYNTEQKLQSTQEKMWSMEWDLKSLKKELTLAKEDLSSSKQSLNSLSDKLAETEARLEETEDDLGEASVKVDETLLQLNSTRSVLRASQTELLDEKERANRLEAKNERLEEDFSQLSRNTVINRDIMWSDNFSPYNKWTYSLKVNRINYVVYVTSYHPFDIDYRRIDEFITSKDPAIKNISDILDGHYVESEKLAEHVLAFVQSLTYEEDMDEYPRYPLETLVEGGGDCEDKSILYASLMKALGYDVVLLDFWDHVMIGVALPDPVPESLMGRKSFVHNGKRYYTAETTSKYWRLGEMLEDYENKKPTIYPV